MKRLQPRTEPCGAPKEKSAGRELDSHVSMGPSSKTQAIKELCKIFRRETEVCRRECGSRQYRKQKTHREGLRQTQHHYPEPAECVQLF